MQSDQQKIKNLTAAFFLSLDPPPKGQPSHMHGIMFFARRPKDLLVRIKMQGPFGSLLFDMVRKGKEVQIYIPSRRTLYRGLTNKQKKTGNAWGEILSSMFADFSSMALSSSYELSFKKDMLILPLLNGELWIDRKRALIREWHHGGRIITYDRYESQPDLPSIPTLIRLKTTDGSKRAECRLSQVSVNSNLDHVFDLSSHEPQFVRDIKELNVR